MAFLPIWESFQGCSFGFCSSRLRQSRVIATRQMIFFEKSKTRDMYTIHFPYAYRCKTMTEEYRERSSRSCCAACSAALPLPSAIRARAPRNARGTSTPLLSSGAQCARSTNGAERNTTRSQPAARSAHVLRTARRVASPKWCVMRAHRVPRDVQRRLLLVSGALSAWPVSSLWHRSRSATPQKPSHVCVPSLGRAATGKTTREAWSRHCIVVSVNPK